MNEIYSKLQSKSKCKFEFPPLEYPMSEPSEYNIIISSKLMELEIKHTDTIQKPTGLDFSKLIFPSL